MLKLLIKMIFMNPIVLRTLIRLLNLITAYYSIVFFFNRTESDVLEFLGLDWWLFAYCFEWACVIVAGLLSPFLGFVGFFWITASAGMISAALLATRFNFFFDNGASVSVEVGHLAKLGQTKASLSLYVDYIGYAFALLTLTIGACAYIYAFSYMRFEKNILNFLVFLEIFKLSMVLLVWSNSWFTLILGWELIGVSSFLLINFWTYKITTLKSAFKALSFNKLSDAALISAACVSLFFGANTIQAAAHFGGVMASKSIHTGLITLSANDFFVFCIVVAAFCKSAQFGFHFWLPDSMEAPVPASALIHSATLVSAGIYLVIRFNFCLFASEGALVIFKSVTSATAFYGALIASFQTDVKKILAYSTISHCGILMYSITLGRVDITLFYLFAHGFFKSLSFLCVGNFIQYANNYQDVSKMGGLGHNYRLETFILFICAFNLSSSPLLLAFFSKHWVLNASPELSYVDVSSIVLIFSAAFCGFFYSSKLFYETIVSKKRAHRCAYNAKATYANNYQLIRRSNALAALAIMVLCVACVATLTLLLQNVAHASCVLPDNGLSYQAVKPLIYGAASMLFFCQLLFVTALSYTCFKRHKTSVAALALIAIVFATVTVL